MTRSEPFEAASRAETLDEARQRRAERIAEFVCGQKGDVGFVTAILSAHERDTRAAALPPDPAPETLQAMWHAYLTAQAEEEMLDAYRALRASLLPGEEPS